MALMVSQMNVGPTPKNIYMPTNSTGSKTIINTHTHKHYSNLVGDKSIETLLIDYIKNMSNGRQNILKDERNSPHIPKTYNPYSITVNQTNVGVISIPIGVKHKHCVKDVRDGAITKRLEHCLGIQPSQSI